MTLWTIGYGNEKFCHTSVGSVWEALSVLLAFLQRVQKHHTHSFGTVEACKTIGTDLPCISEAVRAQILCFLKISTSSRHHVNASDLDKTQKSHEWWTNCCCCCGTGVQPVVGPLFRAKVSFWLSDLVFMVRKLEIFAARMQVEFTSEHCTATTPHSLEDCQVTRNVFNLTSPSQNTRCANPVFLDPTEIPRTVRSFSKPSTERSLADVSCAGFQLEND